jgi:hypothetical protein
MLDHSRNAKRVSWIQVLGFAFSCQPKLTFNDDRIGCKFVMVDFIFGIGFPAPFQDFLVALFQFLVSEIFKSQLPNLIHGYLLKEEFDQRPIADQRI